MLRLTAIEFIVRTIPEAFIYIFAAYLLSNTRINLNRYIISSLLFAVSTFIIRMLPINYGVHTILVIIVETIILVSINKINVIQAIKSTIIMIICLFILETLNVLMLGLVLKDQLKEIMQDPILKIVYGLPSLICFMIVVGCYYYIIRKRKFRNVKD